MMLKKLLFWISGMLIFYTQTAYAISPKKINTLITSIISNLENNYNVDENIFIDDNNIKQKDHLLNILDKIKNFFDESTSIECNIKIIKHHEPIIFSLPNATIIISIPLINTINSNDEWMALLLNEYLHILNKDNYILFTDEDIDNLKYMKTQTANHNTNICFDALLSGIPKYINKQKYYDYDVQKKTDSIIVDLFYKHNYSIVALKSIINQLYKIPLQYSLSYNPNDYKKRIVFINKQWLLLGQPYNIDVTPSL